jgi:membrane protein required for colicin V production
MTLVDWAIVIIMVLAVLGGLAQGFLRSVFSLGGLLAGLVLAAWNYGRVARHLIHVVRFESVANTIGFLLIVLIVAGLVGLTGSILSKMLHKIGLGCLDRIAGGIFGFFQGAFIITLCILVSVAFFPKAQWLKDGRLPPLFFGICHVSTHVTPEDLAKKVRVGLRELEKKSPVWLHADHNGL